MDIPSQQTPEKSSREVLTDFLRELVGYDQGIGRTLIDLRKKPHKVLQGYLSGQGHYVSPFRLLFTALGLWLFVNTFVIDWYAVWYGLMKQQTVFLDDLLNVPAEKIIRNARDTERFMRTYSTFCGDIFSKYYVPFVVLVLPLSAWISGKFCKLFQVPFRSILVANTYAVATNTILFFLMSVGLALSAWITIVMIFILLILAFTGHNFLTLIPLRNFYPENGRAIERKILSGTFLAVMIIFSIYALIYFAREYAFH